MKHSILFLLINFPFLVSSQTVSKYIVTDQFGYRPTSEKIAVIRNPITGFDENESFSPSSTYALVDATNNTQVFTTQITPWNSGKEDTSSGDKAWWFNFSTFETPGTYYVLDIQKNVKSFDFIINENIYNEVLKHAIRTFFYQRAGNEKAAQYAGNKWADNASHLGALQDTQARIYNDSNNTSTEKDVSGGWYDAGDYNKYTTWTSNYIVDMLRAYLDNPNAFTDDYNLPYSGNGIPDIIDEVKWGLDHLLKLQEVNGSMISIVSLSHASPPSSATGQSLYGAVNTSCTLAAASALSLGSKIFSDLGMTDYSNTLLTSAEKAWNWANENPNIVWKNNDAEYNSVGIGAGQQEVDDYGRFTYKIRAAVNLFDIKQKNNYKNFVENNYLNVNLMQWNYAFPFQQENQEVLLLYSTLPNVTESVSNRIKSTYKNAMQGEHNFAAFNSETDPYLAHLDAYTWGSNHIKARKALLFLNYIKYNIDPEKNNDALTAAERYIHYIHGVNPLSICYLSNMYDYGADNSVNEFYHTWFHDNSDWDNVLINSKGPAPGFLVGGANPSYDWDSCCNTSSCGSKNSECDITQVNRVKNQPKQKSYDQFNTSWPMNSWSITENSCGYQVAYIRVLSEFTGTNESLSINKNIEELNTLIYPNPFKNDFTIISKEPFLFSIYDITGRLISNGNCKDNSCILGKTINTSGIYFIKIYNKNSSKTFKIVKE